MKKDFGILSILSVIVIIFFCCIVNCSLLAAELDEFTTPPDAARPWVYWFVMDGNLTKEGITADFESMRDKGIGGFIMMEVNVGVPRGEVDFMREKWQQLFVHIVREAERCGLQMTLPSGPGWAGSGGPWIKPEKSILHLVSTEKNVNGPVDFDEVLPTPTPRSPFFGEGALPPDIEKARKEFFQDVCVLAFPTPKEKALISDIDEKAVYVRAPYSSTPGVRAGFDAPAEFEVVSNDAIIDPVKIVNLTDEMDKNGKLTWQVPAGNWTILRFAATSTGANTRPAPAPGMGLESSKIDRDAFDIHAENYINKLLKIVGERQTDGKAGWCYFHIDSWEMGPQNYSPLFFNEFQKRRGYDPTPFLPAYTGAVVQSVEKTERFLWDLRQTAQELIIENHAEYLKEVAHKNNLKISLEPYDMMPCCDMTFGAVADIPMCEFWSNTFDTVFSCFEAASIANTHGKPVVSAEAFTSGGDSWRENPKSMKQRGDWAFCSGVNRFTFHRFQHQPFVDRFPGFSMGGIGVHWERTQTWWPLISDYHKYLSRCQHMLQQGTAVVDVLYLLPEGAPRVFTPPASALIIDGTIKDQRGYRFDGCDPSTLIKLATVENGLVTFPNATKYKMLVLPNVDTMTPELLQKIEQLVNNGAVIVGQPPRKSPSLQNYPKADIVVNELADKMWNPKTKTVNTRDTAQNAATVLQGLTAVKYGSGTIYVPNKEKSKANAKAITFDGAKWIWFPEGNPAHDAPAGKRYFRKTFVVNDATDVNSAQLLAVADNYLIVKINGTEVYRADLQDTPVITEFANKLKTGENTIEIDATNGENDQRNPAGFVAQLEIISTKENGTPVITRLATDDTWQVSLDKKVWKQALTLGNFGMGPWAVSNPGVTPDELYPKYSVTSEILKSRGIQADFASKDDSLRFYHRNNGNSDYYFVANRNMTPYNDEVVIRTAGKKVSIWDPITGKRFNTTNATQTTDTTKFTLALEGAESVFIVFDESGADAAEPVWRQLKFNPELELDTDWSVQFEQSKGGPENAVHFDKLIDWTNHDNDCIKYFSGVAKYSKTFEHKKDNQDIARVFIDLGDVEVMAKVIINGKTVGTRWIAPYRFEVTDYLKEGKNELEIEVANLWPNRLIGDAKLPEKDRTTWSTWKNGGYNENSPLYPSGLLGPVKLLKEQLK
ncbi:MAG: glycosyl hydrolase [Thermoguttaceae bacterium]